MTIRLRLSPGGAALAHAALALGGFTLGVTEFASMGVLPLFSADLGVGAPTAGEAISAYALGVVVGAPLLALAGARLSRRALLLALLAGIAACNLLSAAAPSFGALLVFRFLSGQPFEEAQHLPAPQLPSIDNTPAGAHPVDLKHVLRQIEPDYSDLLHLPLPRHDVPRRHPGEPGQMGGRPHHYVTRGIVGWTVRRLRVALGVAQERLAFDYGRRHSGPRSRPLCDRRPAAARVGSGP